MQTIENYIDLIEERKLEFLRQFKKEQGKYLKDTKKELLRKAKERQLSPFASEDDCNLDVDPDDPLESRIIAHNSTILHSRRSSI